jgi:hypothetical protein
LESRPHILPTRIAEDPTNLYGYAISDPVNWIDPFGLEEKVGWGRRIWEGLKSALFNLQPDPVITPTAEVLLDPKTPTTLILIMVKNYNEEQALKEIAAPGSSLPLIDPTWASEHPLEALKIVRDYEREKKTPRVCP